MAKTTKKQGLGGANKTIEKARGIIHVFDEEGGNPEIRTIMTDSKKGQMTGEDLALGKDLLQQAEKALPTSTLGKSAVMLLTSEVNEKEEAVWEIIGRMKRRVKGDLQELGMKAELAEFNSLTKKSSGTSGAIGVAKTILLAAGVRLDDVEAAEAELAPPINPKLAEAILKTKISADDLEELKQELKSLVKIDQNQERGKGTKQGAVKGRESVVKQLSRWNSRWTGVAQKYLTEAQLTEMALKPRAKPTRKKKPAEEPVTTTVTE